MPKIVLGVSSSYCAGFLKGQVRFLVQQGFSVIIISGPGEAIRSLASDEGARLVELDFSKRIAPLSDIILLGRIVRLLRNEKPDIVNAGNPKSGFLIMVACWLAGIQRKLFTLHGLYSDTQTGMRRLLISSTERICCRIAQRVIVVSPSLKRHAEQRGILKPGKGLVIENGSCNGVDTLFFSGAHPLQEPSQQLRADLNMPEQITIGFTGRISRDKGVDILLDAFARLRTKHPRVQLLVVGPVEADAAGSAVISERLYNTEGVYCTGMLRDVRPAYCLMDMLVLPSLREGLGNVLLEASAMELPVVAADIPGCRDALVNGETGILFEKGKVGALTDALERLVQDPLLRQQMGRSGRAFVQDNFKSERIWQGLLKVYRQS